jgi:hypothetical protein
LVPPPDFAVKVAVCAVLTADIVAVKVAEVAPAATVTDDGTTTAVLLLARLTAWPPLPAAAFSVAVQVSVPAPVSDPLAQLRLLNTGCPVPLRLIVDVVPLDELLVSVTVPSTSPAAVGAKFTVSVAVWPGFRVNGKLTPEIVYPTPLTDPALTVTAAVPEELSVAAPVPVPSTATVPKPTLVALRVSVGTAAPRLIA